MALSSVKVLAARSVCSEEEGSVEGQIHDQELKFLTSLQWLAGRQGWESDGQGWNFTIFLLSVWHFKFWKSDNNWGRYDQKRSSGQKYFVEYAKCFFENVPRTMAPSPGFRQTWNVTWKKTYARHSGRHLNLRTIEIQSKKQILCWAFCCWNVKYPFENVPRTMAPSPGFRQTWNVTWKKTYARHSGRHLNLRTIEIQSKKQILCWAFCSISSRQMANSPCWLSLQYLGQCKTWRYIFTVLFWGRAPPSYGSNHPLKPHCLIQVVKKNNNVFI